MKTWILSLSAAAAALMVACACPPKDVEKRVSTSACVRGQANTCGFVSIHGQETLVCQVTVHADGTVEPGELDVGVGREVLLLWTLEGSNRFTRRDFGFRLAQGDPGQFGMPRRVRELGDNGPEPDESTLLVVPFHNSRRLTQKYDLDFQLQGQPFSCDPTIVNMTD